MDIEKCVPKFNVILLYIETFVMEYMKTSFLYQQTTLGTAKHFRSFL